MTILQLSGTSVLRALFVLIGCLLPHASAISASIAQTYQNIFGNDWTTEFTVINDGNPALLGEFTVYFPATDFSNLSVVASPATWDSIVIQPDGGIPADGFFDALVIDSADSLSHGQQQGGFVVGFQYLGQGRPAGLPFDFLDSNFQVVFSGVTTVSAVPEPSESVLLALGLLVVAGIARKHRHAKAHCCRQMPR